MPPNTHHTVFSRVAVRGTCHAVYSNDDEQLRMSMITNKDVSDRAVVATVNETMATLKIGRAKLYELLNSRELESYLEGSSRKITWRSVDAYVERRLTEEAKRRGQTVRCAAAE